MRCFLIALLLTASLPALSQSSTPAPHLLDLFMALAGEWRGNGLDGNSAPNASMRFEVTADANAVVKTPFPGTLHEMRTVYIKDGDDVVLTHFCACGRRP